MTKVAAANDANMMPMVVADRPIATPKMGTEQMREAPDGMVLTIRMRRRAHRQQFGHAAALGFLGAGQRAGS